MRRPVEAGHQMGLALGVAALGLAAAIAAPRAQQAPPTAPKPLVPAAASSVALLSRR